MKIGGIYKRIYVVEGKQMITNKLQCERICCVGRANNQATSSPPNRGFFPDKTHTYTMRELLQQWLRLQQQPRLLKSEKMTTCFATHTQKEKLACHIKSFCIPFIMIVSKLEGEVFIIMLYDKSSPEKKNRELLCL